MPDHDIGLTHIALVVTNIQRSVTFYQKYARMRVVHRREEADGSTVVWLTDLTRPFVIVLANGPTPEPGLGPFAHLGVGCTSAAEVDALTEQAAAEGCLRIPPHDSGYPVGYWAMLSDPDGHTLELAFGQEVGLTVEQASA